MTLRNVFITAIFKLSFLILYPIEAPINEFKELHTNLRIQNNHNHHPKYLGLKNRFKSLHCVY